MATQPPTETTGADLTVPAEQTAACLNCGATLAGEYCHDCGQRDTDPRASLWEVLGEFAQESLELDGRLPRTLLPFLFFPGWLAHEFLEGRRARYTSPVRLYVFIALVSFFMLARATDQAISDEAIDSAPVIIDEHGIRAGPSRPEEETTASASPPEAPARPTFQVITDPGDDTQAANEVLPAGSGLDEDGRLMLPDQAPAGLRRFDGLRPSQALHQALDAFYGWLPIGTVALLLAYALLLKLFYWRTPLLTHLVASTHVHAFVLLSVGVAATIGQPTAWLVALGVINLYILVGMWRTYEQRFLVTLLKFMGLAGMYGVLLGASLSLVVIAATLLG